jgi:hypothetical protein
MMEEIDESTLPVLLSSYVVSSNEYETLRHGGRIKKFHAGGVQEGALIGVSNHSRPHYDTTEGIDQFIELIDNPDAVVRITKFEPLDLKNPEHIDLLNTEYGSSWKNVVLDAERTTNGKLFIVTLEPHLGFQISRDPKMQTPMRLLQ